jgi:hypothetical protein
VKIDKTGITYKDPDPPMESETKEDYVDFKVSVTDTDSYNINHGINVSGVNRSTLEYRLRYPGHDWGGWNTSGIKTVTETQAETRIEVRISALKVGTNYIQLRGGDNAGNLGTCSEAFTIIRKNNVPEAPKWLKPNSTAETRPRITWGPGHDEDGDPLEYFIQIGIQVQEDYIFSWRSTGSNLHFDLDQDLKRYVTYIVQVKAFDGMDHSPVIQTTMNITGSANNIPPSAPTNITTVLTDVNPYICWEKSFDPDSENLTYYIRMGRQAGRGDVFDWKHVPLSCAYQLPLGLNITDGMFHIEVQAFDGEGYSDIAYATLKVVTFEIFIEDFALNLTPGAEFEYSLKVLNKAVLSDNVSFVFNGSLFEVADIYVNTEEYHPEENRTVDYYFEANELLDLWVRFEVPEDVPYGNYTFNIYAYSENGELSGVLEKDYADVNEPDQGPPKKDRSWDELCAAYWLPIVIIAVALMLCANIAYYIYKKRKGEWGEEQEQDEEYLGGGKEEDEEEDMPAKAKGRRVPEGDADEPPPTPDEEAEEEVEAELISDEELSDLDDLLEPPPEGLELEEPEPEALLPGTTPGDLGPDSPNTLKQLSPSEGEGPEESVDIPTIDAVCTACGETSPVDITVDPRTIPCPHCGQNESLAF